MTPARRRPGAYPAAFWRELAATLIGQTGFGVILAQFVHQRGFPLDDMGVMAAVMEAIPGNQSGTVQGWFQTSGTLGAALLVPTSVGSARVWKPCRRQLVTL